MNSVTRAQRWASQSSSQRAAVESSATIVSLRKRHRARKIGSCPLVPEVKVVDSLSFRLGRRFERRALLVEVGGLLVGVRHGECFRFAI
jgi:hypothetical protein